MQFYHYPFSWGGCKKKTDTPPDWAAGMVGTYTDQTTSTYKSTVTEITSTLIGIAETGGSEPLDSVVLNTSGTFTIHEIAGSFRADGSGTYSTNTLAYSLQFTDRTTGSQSVVHHFNGIK